MNYYEHHLGDYLRDAAHLTLIEEGAYRRLLDLYYTRERAFPGDVGDVCRLARVSDLNECGVVEIVLREFFTLTAEGWTHPRCDREIARFADKLRKAQASARVRWSQPDRNANGMRTHTERIANGVPSHTEGSADAIRSECEGNALQAPSTKHQAPIPFPPSSEKNASSRKAPNPPPALRGDPNLGEIPTRAIVPLDPAFELPLAWGEDAEKLGWIAGAILRESERFRQFFVTGKGAGKRRSVKGWRQSWANWLAKAERFDTRGTP